MRTADTIVSPEPQTNMSTTDASVATGIDDAEALFKEAKRRERRRRLFVLASVLTLTLALAGGLVAAFGNFGATHHGRIAPSSLRPGLPPVPPLPITAASASTAYAIAQDALVPVGLASGVRGSGFSVPNIFDAVVTRDGSMAYALTGTYSGPVAIVPVNLKDRSTGPAISLGVSVRGLPLFAGPVGSLTSPSMEFPDLAITPNGKAILVADANTNSVIAVDVQTRKVDATIKLPEERSIGSVIALAHHDYGQLGASLWPIADIAVSPNGRFAYVVDGTAVLPIDLANETVGKPVTGFDYPLAIAIAPNGNTAYVTNPGCWSVLKAGSRSGTCVKEPTIPNLESNSHIGFSADGDHVSVVNLRTDVIEKDIDVGANSQPTGVAISPDGTKVYVTNGEFQSDEDKVTVISAASESVIGRLTYGSSATRGSGGAYGIAISPNGKTAYIGQFVCTPALCTGTSGAPPIYEGLVAVDLTSKGISRPIPLPNLATVSGYQNVSVGVAFAFQVNPSTTQ